MRGWFVVTKRVLDIGNCGPDHYAIRQMLLRQFGAEVEQAHELSDALEILGKAKFDLVLINRKLDIDYSDGMDVLAHLKGDARYRDLPMMLITNFAEHEAAAIAAGAVPGFGKRTLYDDLTVTRLSQFLAS
ncbi:response regulator receiver protein [Pirellula staleyi DSM 6068]|uniref:Response regulator receiver protein n=1 Tax=Pirellula staleyi (strain ATCC 27377 / DSM 6068 / ICPB 4128) TaxID=530564 RepID=D2QYE0_PIRSD|nr:response regulator receiver protein [Pirellula staleyi DSM 6068]